MGESVVKVKSFAFAVRIVNLHKIMTVERKEYVIANVV